MKCVNVLLPLHVEQLYTYLVPASLNNRVTPGCRVTVPFGKSKMYTGIVIEAEERDVPEGLKEIAGMLDEQPFVSAEQMALWQWISSYYICFAGDVLRAALPSGLQWDKAESFSPITERHIRRALPPYEGALTAKQSQLLTILSNTDKPEEGIARRNLIKMPEGSEAILSALLKKGAAEAYERVVPPRINFEETQQATPLPLLEGEQILALKTISDAATKQKPVLLHGVAGSGKSTICAHLINKVLQSGKQVLYLIPDTKATSYSIARLSRYFGNQTAVYHAKTSQRDRLNLWSVLSAGRSEPLLVIGVHSALFLPFTNLGLIIVDEEHDDGYKHSASAPRYHARNVALMLAKLHNAAVVLSSAAPAIESYNHALSGKYALATLGNRYNGAPPTIHIENSAELRRKKIQKGLFSPLLLEKMEQAFAANEQVVLFHNRKHYARVLECDECGWTPVCSRCQVALPYAKQKNRLICSYCGSGYPLPTACPDCGGKTKLKGVGTERIEDESQALFPDLRIARMDSETVTSEQQFFAMVDRFNMGEIDLIIGTQMIVGNIDFARVRLVGVVNGDLLLNVPDFRAHEKAFQTLTQLAGYAGRDGSPSDVVIQAGQTPLMRAVKEYDYTRMYALQCGEREQYDYPPFTRLIRVVLSGANEETLFAMAREYHRLLTAKLGSRVSGPVEMPVREGKYAAPTLVFLLKIEASASFVSVRSVISGIYATACAEIADFKKLRIVYDVDPV